MSGKNLSQPWQQVQGVYVHIPFCVQKCLYCDFTSLACHSKELMERYTEVVCRQIAFCSRRTLPVNQRATVYFGGGTPSVLSAELLEQIVGALKEYGFWQEPAEATIEVNPGTADMEKLTRLRNMGFDRISFGVQSLNDVELRTIGRIHTAQEALTALAEAREAGFERVSADLIYGLPGQTMASLAATLQQLTATGIEHLSVYGLTVEEDTPLARLLDEGRLVLPDEDESADMYEFVQQFLAQAGFERYEISNYAKNGQFSRHNLVYWQYLPYAAFGAAACGFDGCRRLTGTDDVERYVQDAPKGIFTADEETLSPQQQLSEFMFMNLRKGSGADLAAAKERFGADVYGLWQKQLDAFIAQGLVIYDKDGQNLRLAEKGMELANQVFEIFVSV